MEQSAEGGGGEGCGRAGLLDCGDILAAFAFLAWLIVFNGDEKH